MFKKKQREYYGGRIKGLVESVAMFLSAENSTHPNIEKIQYDARHAEFELLHTILSQMFEGYGDKGSCFNCKRSMEIDVYTADVLDARLLLLVGAEVRKRTREGMPFHEANLIRIQDLDTTLSVKCRTTQNKYLGLMRQPEEGKNKGLWFITAWGWKVLRGEEIPKKARYWDGKFLGRSEEMTTLTGMLQEHLDGANYSPSDWTEFGGYIEDENPDI